MALKTFEQGDLVRVVARLKDTAGLLVDPSGLTFNYRSDAAALTTLLTYPSSASLVRQSEGIYYVDLDTSTYSGRWSWQFSSTGTAQATEQGEFFVRRSFARN